MRIRLDHMALADSIFSESRIDSHLDGCWEVYARFPKCLAWGTPASEVPYPEHNYES